jgi:hypothetical protein
MEKITKLTPLVGAFLIFCGVLHLYIYYHFFHILIFNYLDFSEILVSFFNLMVVLIALITTIFSGLFAFYTNFLNTSKILPYKFTVFYFKKKNLWTLILLVVSTLFLYCLVLVSPDNPDSKTVLFSTWFVAIFGCTFLVFGLIWPIALEAQEIILDSQKIILPGIEPEPEKKIYHYKYIILYVVLFVFMGVQIFTIQEVRHKIKDKNKIRVTIVTIDNDTIITNSTHYYIGRTNNYVFLFDSLDNKTDVFPVSQIKKYTFKNIK